MKVVLADHAGACYGVQRALDLADAALREDETAYTLGPLIHNPQVVASLAQRGARVVEQADQVDGGTVIVRSHGVTPQERAELERRAEKVVDATCPHVARAQKAAAKLAELGCVLVVGEPGHPEVAALREYARAAGARVHVVLDPADLPADLPACVGVVVQTTQRAETLRAVMDALEQRGIRTQVKDTICAATTERQAAAEKLATQVDAMVVIGGKNSSNTTRLAEICALHCSRTFHVESAAEVHAALFADGDTVGVTAGASTPEDQITSVVNALRRL
ncbi:4-hydroxy-3-methylbut-2-enyl diphosphate reductase [Adlercreutzia murintestinalis]|uniref:4-hydroxy-3-methylbut-2-enyl diphosphate reductase n=1 Tax=Adlercreutzia murintestinalis TaxID=2941325 RepID=UPI00203C1097|nr:4-hydroxy-3-methylbut-2-enyl diphosphate reductase [Adlercreutzia murintestinalis]